MHSAFRIAGVGVGAFLLLAATGAALFNHSGRAAHIGLNALDHIGDRAQEQAEGQVEEEMINRTFPVQPGERLLVEVIHSDIHIEKSEGSEARVRVTLEGREIDDRAREFFEYLNFEVGQTNGKLFVRTDPDGKWSWRKHGWRRSASVHVYIAVPEVFDAKMNIAHGDVDIDALKGVLNVDLAHGDIDAESLSGSALAMDIAHGDAQTGRLGSERIRVNLQHGDLSADRVDANDIELSAAHGDIDIDHAAAETIRIRTAHGDLDMHRVTAGKIDAKASHGDIDVREMDGYPRMEAQHGDISLHFREATGGEFSIAHGDIDLSAPAAAALDVDLKASEVSIDRAFRFEGVSKDKEMQGRLNGGGPELYARASHGEVALRTR